MDFKNINTANYYEATICDIFEDKLLLRYIIDSKIYEEWIDYNSNLIQPAGRFSSNSDQQASEINNTLYKFKNNKIFLTENQDMEFKKKLKSINLIIKDIKGDGNCLYRAVCDQIYGSDDKYEILKNACLDYIEIESNFFGEFIDGGIKEIDNYIRMKRINGKFIIFINRSMGR